MLGCELKQVNEATARHCIFAYSALACFRMGMSGSASFQSERVLTWQRRTLIVQFSPNVRLPDLSHQKFSNIHTLVFCKDALMAKCRPSRAGMAHIAVRSPFSGVPGCSQMVCMFPFKSK